MIEYNELLELNYCVKWLQRLRADVKKSWGDSASFENKAILIYRSILRQAEKCNLGIHQCECSPFNMIELSNTIFVPQFEGLVATCPYCRLHYFWFNDAIDVHAYVTHRENDLNYFKSKPRWLVTLTGFWIPERCYFENIKMTETNKDEWQIDFLTLKEIKEWQTCNDGAYYWHKNLRDKFSEGKN